MCKMSVIAHNCQFCEKGSVLPVSARTINDNYSSNIRTESSQLVRGVGKNGVPIVVAWHSMLGVPPVDVGVG